MAQIEDAVYSILTGDGDVSGLVSTRIYPHVARQDAVLPCITFSRISGEHGQHMGGGTGSANVRLMIISWAQKSSSALALAEHVRDALQGYRGTAGGVDVSAVISDGDSTDAEQVVTGREQFVYNVSHEYTFWFAEAIPV
jgi:hypothetical protein